MISQRAFRVLLGDYGKTLTEREAAWLYATEYAFAEAILDRLESQHITPPQINADEQKHFLRSVLVYRLTYKLHAA